MPTYSHSPGKSGQSKLLREHLLEVATRAASYAAAFGAQQQALLASLLHDLGKYGLLFKLHLEGKEKGLDHWTVGAVACFDKARSFGAYVVAPSIAILGHHIGLPLADTTALRKLADPTSLEPSPPELRLTHLGYPLHSLYDAWASDGLSIPDPPTSGIAADPKIHSAFLNDVRFLFSTLTDADFIQTDAHFEGKTPEELGRDTGPSLDPLRILAAIDIYLEKNKRQSSANVVALRSNIRADCEAAAELAPGLFTLTAPTGSGKTLSSLRFAALHAQRNGLRRIIFVVPYLTIADQLVRILTELFATAGFPERYLLVHTAASAGESVDDAGPDPEKDPARRELQAKLAENWDAPFIVTTNVQFLESLFANRPGKCRKLHRIASSVVLMDEVQTIPNSLACATLATLSRIAEKPFNTSIVFMTATQPAFSSLNDGLNRHWKSAWNPHSITTRIAENFVLARRVTVEWPGPERTEWQQLAARIKALPGPCQALVIVNVKKHALELLEAIGPEKNTRLLSTAMCPAHRIDVLAAIHHELKTGQECIVIATQCVEAGVDIDFPNVFRALAPLDAIAQAAGRCNRNGMRQTGQFCVFRTHDDALPLDAAYKMGTDLVNTFLQDSTATLDLDDPATYDRYYRAIYKLSGLEHQQSKLLEATDAHNFPVIATLYRLIDDSTVQIVVPYDEKAFQGLREELEKDGFTAAWARKARHHAVSVFRSADNVHEKIGIPIRNFRGEPPFIPGWYILGNSQYYDRTKLGLILPRKGDLLNG